MCLGLFPDLQAPGGIQRGSRHMAAAIADLARRKNLDCKFLSLNDPAGHHEDEVAGLAYQYTGFQRSKPRFVLSALQAASAKPRLIFVAHANLAPVGWLANRRAQAPMAVVGWGIEVWEPLPLIRRSAVQSADALLAISKFTAARFSDKQGVAPQEVHLLPLALDPSFRLADGDATLPTPPAWFPKGRVLLSVTRLAAVEGYKGVDTTIRALARLQAGFPDLHYLIVGDGDDRPRLERLARDLGVSSQVHFIGRLAASDPALLSCYANCDLFVLPSKGEGFGIVFLEAMAFGKPVIGGCHGGTPDVIEDGVSGFLVKHGDEQRLAQIIERLLRDASLREIIGTRARSRVKNYFQFENFRQHLETILELILERRGECAS
jgi:phosphatidyl-myo-inositol dimannoside synthase